MNMNNASKINSKFSQYGGGFKDVLISSSSKVNNRDVLSNNIHVSTMLTQTYLESLVTNGTLNKIISIKTGGSLNETYTFDDEDSKEIYDDKLSHHVRDAVRAMLYFGRSILVFFNYGDDLSKPLNTNYDKDNIKIRQFDGSQVQVPLSGYDLMGERYYKPILYSVNGENIHWTRVVDFVYKKSSHLDLPKYRYGGISETELIYAQLIRDENLQKASSNIVDKASNIFYKLKDLKNIMRQYSNDQDCEDYKGVMSYYEQVEELRARGSGATVIDSEDDVISLSQQLNGLPDLDNVSKSALSLVTGIPKFVLTSEKPSGIGSSNSDDMNLLQFTLKNLQIEHLIRPIKQACCMLGISGFKFKDAQQADALKVAQTDLATAQTAQIIGDLSEDAGQYLSERGLTYDDDNDDNDEHKWDDLLGLSDD